MRRILLPLALALLVGRPAEAQPIHLPPVPDATFPPDHVLLSITPPSTRGGRTDIFKDPISGIRIADGQMLIMSTVSTEMIDLRDLTIAQLVEQLRGKYTGLSVYAPEPELKTSLLAEGTMKPNAANAFSIGGRRPRPSVHPDLGIALSMAEAADRDASGALLRNIGLHLDLVGTKQFERATIRARIGLSNAPDIAVKDSTEPVSGATDGANNQRTTSVDAFVETTQSVIMGAQLDLKLLDLGSEGAYLGWGLEFAALYSAFEGFTYDSIRVGPTEWQSVEETFSAGEIARSLQILDRVRPTRTVLTGPRITFGNREDYAFYMLAEIGRTNVYDRTVGIRFLVDQETQARTPIGLLPRIERRPIGIFRAGIGVKLGKNVNIRADAITARGDRTDRVPPQLRLLVATSGLRFD